MTTVDGYKYVAFTGKAKQPDGSYLVSGRISDTSLDLDGQRCDGEWLEEQAHAWFKKYANIREMHQPVAVGRAKSLTGNAIDGFDIMAKVVDPGAVLKLDEGLYNGFSFGSKNTRIDRSEKALAMAPNGVINGGEWIEVSIVDVPANPNARFTLAKAADIGDTLDLHSVVDGAPPCSECGGIGKTLMDGNWSTCEKCNGNGEGKNDILPGLNSGPDEKGEAGKVADIYGYAEGETVKSSECSTCKGTGKIKDGNMDCPDCIQKNADLDTYKKAFTDKERSDLASKDQAMPGGGFPIRNVSDLKNAIQAYGRAKDKAATKAWIIRKAKELKSTDLLPDAWGITSKMADAMIALSLVNKGAEPGQYTHDPEMLGDVKNGIVQCIQQELEELCNGDDERWDLQNLLEVLNGFLSWQLHEAFEGETTSPFGGDDMDMITLGVSPDTIKAARADGATEAEKQAPIAELSKSLGIDKIAESTQDIVQKVADLAVVVETVSKMSAPREWALRQSEEQTETAVQLDLAQSKVTQYKAAQAELSSPTDKAAYESLIQEEQAKVAALSARIGV